MSNNTIKNKIQEIFEDQFPGQKIRWEQKWKEYHFSSIQWIYFLKEIEAEWGPIDMVEFNTIKSAEDLSKYIGLKTNAYSKQ